MLLSLLPLEVSASISQWEEVSNDGDIDTAFLVIRTGQKDSRIEEV